MSALEAMPVATERNRLRLLVRICAALVGGIGFVALLGWVLGQPHLASLGSGMIPVAPSTATLLILYAIAVFLRGHLPLHRGTYWTGYFVTVAGAMIALLLFVLSSLGIHPDAERLGFAIVQVAGEIPKGHMSPVTAFCFLLASLSFLASLSSSPDRPWRAALGWGVACLLIIISLVLVLAYLYGDPLLYGSPFIPPAALTSVAFAALGIALLGLVGPDIRFFRQPQPTRRASYAFILIFILLATGVVTAGYFFYKRYEKNYRLEVERQLSSIADLKVDQVRQWRKERLSDADVFYGNASFSGLVRHYLERPADAETRGTVLAWLRHFQKTSQYDQLFLLDAKGIVRMSVPDERRTISRRVVLHAAEALRKKQVAFEDFCRNEFDQRVYLAILVPILDEQADGRALGTLIMRIDPEKYLYPFVNRWPTPSRTAETLLVRREGNEVLYLTESRFQNNTALTLRISLDRKDNPVVQAVMGREGIVEGRNYRNVSVVADVHAVPDSPWFLVARMDSSEVYQPLEERLWIMVGFVFFLLFGAGAGMGLVWRQQLTQFYQVKYEATNALRESEAKLKEAQKMAQLGNWKWDVKTGLVEWSEEVYKIFHLDPSKFTPQIDSILSLSPWPEDRERDKELIRKAMESHEKGDYEQRFLRPDGSIGYYYSTFQGKYDDKGNLASIVGTVLDITERKLAEGALRESEEKYRRLIETTGTGYVILDEHSRVLDANQEYVRLTGRLQREDIIGHTVTEWTAPHDLERNAAEVRKCLEQGFVRNLEIDYVAPDGRFIPLEINATVLRVSGSNRILSLCRNITERKQAEEERKSHIFFLESLEQID